MTMFKPVTELNNDLMKYAKNEPVHSAQQNECGKFHIFE